MTTYIVVFDMADARLVPWERGGRLGRGTPKKAELEYRRTFLVCVAGISRKERLDVVMSPFQDFALTQPCMRQRNDS